MTQSQINKVFKTELGQQCIVLFSTPDDAVFIRRDEAVQHCARHKYQTSTIQEWYDTTFRYIDEDGGAYENLD